MMMKSIMDFTWFPESTVVTQRRSRTISYKAGFRDMFAQYVCLKNSTIHKKERHDKCHN